jgi:hypothetical protein
MKKLSLLAAAALVACGTQAHAQPTPPNPVARPTTAAPAPGASGQPGLPGAASNPNGRPSPLSGPQGQNGAMPNTPNGFSSAPGFAPQPGIPIPGMPGSIPSAMPGMPGALGQPGMDPSGAQVTDEEVSAQRIGSVNGVRIFRGQGTYMFEPVKSRKIVRHLTPTTAPAMPTTSAAQPGSQKNPNLPSMVGRPNPQ